MVQFFRVILGLAGQVYAELAVNVRVDLRKDDRRVRLRSAQFSEQTYRFRGVCARGSGDRERDERLVRHAIETAWLKGDMERQYALFGNTVDEKRGKPTNSEFIARVTEALRLEANL